MGSCCSVPSIPSEPQEVLSSTGVMAKTAKLGVIRLDYDYPPAPGDIDYPGSHAYPVVYRVVPGLTFEMAQKGVMTSDVSTRFVEGIKYLESQGVCGITGDCGFMMYFQALARQNTKLPVFMSALAQLPSVTCGYAGNEQIAILTANGVSLKPMEPLIKDECAVDLKENRYIIVGCEDIAGFEAVALGEKVDVNKVSPGMVQKVKKLIADYPGLRAILLECTELPPYADAIRAATGLPVWDAITVCEAFISGVQDNPDFGLNGWQEAWDGKQQAYKFGQSLSSEEIGGVVNQSSLKGTEVQASDNGLRDAQGAMLQQVCLGCIRLDYTYNPVKGDINNPGSHGYTVKYVVVQGLSYNMAKSGQLTQDVEQRLMDAVRSLESQGCCCITSDSGIMMYYQDKVRTATKLPVFMSALVQLPAVTCGFAKNEQIAILTAQSQALEPMRPLLRKECSVDTNESRYIICGVEDVPGFNFLTTGMSKREAIAAGLVNIDEASAGLQKKVMQLMQANPGLRAIVLEDAVFPLYADAIRVASGLPVYDVITGCAFFMAGFKDNPRAGLQNWRTSAQVKAA